MSAPSTVESADGTPIAFHTVGAGAPVIVVGGALRSAEDYLPFARTVADQFEVHVVERRGRGASGPQGEDYSIAKECEDLEAVSRVTAAKRVFGHSYGGLVALEAAKCTEALTHVAVYEPAVSVDGSTPTAWLGAYERLLAAADRRGAFAEFVRGSGHAPAMLGRMPLGYVKLVLRLAIRNERWSRMEPLLEANAAEHHEVRRLDSSTASYERVTARVLLLAGTRSPRSSLTAVEALEQVFRVRRSSCSTGSRTTRPTSTRRRVSPNGSYASWPARPPSETTDGQ